MSLIQEIRSYRPWNEQEERDQKQMLRYMEHNANYLERSDEVAHFSASIWTLNREHTKTLMVYHDIYDSWSWIGGHADGDEDLCRVAMRELTEETGVENASLLSRKILSLETLIVNGHVKRGVYVPSHLHFNLTYLAETDEREALIVNRDENQGVKWFTFEEALYVPKEPWMVEYIYKKLIEKSKKILESGGR